MVPAILLTLGVLVYRLLFLLAGAPVAWANFSPLAAICLCLGAYMDRKLLCLVPFAGILASDVVLNAHYHVPLLDTRMLPGYFCFALFWFLGTRIHNLQRGRVPALFGAALASSILFYLVTNSLAWWFDGPAPLALTPYPHTFSGWRQALTVGHPGFPSPLSFLRNTVVSDQVYTALFIGAQGWSARSSTVPAPTPAHAEHLTH